MITMRMNNFNNIKDYQYSVDINLFFMLFAKLDNDI